MSQKPQIRLKVSRDDTGLYVKLNTENWLMNGTTIFCVDLIQNLTKHQILLCEWHWNTPWSKRRASTESNAVTSKTRFYMRPSSENSLLMTLSYLQGSSPKRKFRFANFLNTSYLNSIY